MAAQKRTRAETHGASVTRRTEAPFLIHHDNELSALVEHLRSRSVIAVDIEANGLHAYRARLCVLQVGWREGDSTAMAIVDALRMNLSALAPILAPDGPVKVLHDLTFDARMLQQEGILLGNVRDTSVAARFLGETSTGLASLTESLLGVPMSKGLQDHDWSRRPFTSQQLRYLAGDVEHLLTLDEQLRARTHDLGIEAEVAVETDYKLLTALRPAKTEGRPAYAAVKGYRKLPPAGRAVLRQLVMARARIAEKLDVPPFRVVANALLLEIARREPTSVAAVRRMCGRRRRAARHAEDWCEAVRVGKRAGAPPEAEERALAPEALPREDLKKRQKLDKVVQRWRRAEAAKRNVDIQVVLPGHRVGAVVTALLSSPAPESIQQALDELEGVGRCRIDRYAPQLVELATRPQPDEPNEAQPAAVPGDATTGPTADAAGDGAPEIAREAEL